MRFVWTFLFLMSFFIINFISFLEVTDQAKPFKTKAIITGTKIPEHKIYSKCCCVCWYGRWLFMMSFFVTPFFVFFVASFFAMLIFVTMFTFFTFLVMMMFIFFVMMSFLSMALFTSFLLIMMTRKILKQTILK